MKLDGYYNNTLTIHIFINDSQVLGSLKSIRNKFQPTL